MKKFQLVAIATMLAGTTLCASAADVQMYGLVATGVVYQHIRHQDTNTLKLANALESSDQSRWGIKGREALQNGWYAGFQLEGGFQPDSGEMANGSKIFDRVARIYVGNETIEVSGGHMAGFTIASDPYSVYGRLGANMTRTSMQGFAPAAFSYQPGYVDNAIAFRTNAKHGLFLQGFYSNGDVKPGVDEEKDFDWSDRRHVGQLATGWVGEKLRFGGVYSYEMQQNTPNITKRDATHGIHLIASYNFGGPAVSGVYYHGKNDWRLGAASDLGKIIGGANGVNGQKVLADSSEGLTTNAFYMSATYPMGKHNLGAALGFVKAEWEGDKKNLKHDDGSAVLGGVIYRYHFSKRTNVYSAISYARGDDLLGEAARFNQCFATVGLVQRF